MSIGISLDGPPAIMTANGSTTEDNPRHKPARGTRWRCCWPSPRSTPLPVSRSSAPRFLDDVSRSSRSTVDPISSHAISPVLLATTEHRQDAASPLEHPRVRHRRRVGDEHRRHPVRNRSAPTVAIVDLLDGTTGLLHGTPPRADSTCDWSSSSTVLPEPLTFHFGTGTIAWTVRSAGCPVRSSRRVR